MHETPNSAVEDGLAVTQPGSVPAAELRGDERAGPLRPWSKRRAGRCDYRRVVPHTSAGLLPGGARYDLLQTPEVRRGKDNGIWLCQYCGGSRTPARRSSRLNCC
jgi:hypothetical protein